MDNQLIENQEGRYGPYGSELPQNYDMVVEEHGHFTDVTVVTGAIVDGLKLWVAKPDGSYVPYQLGACNGPDKNTILLKSREHITKISGTYGNTGYQQDTVITSITIHTNLNRNGYGPYGKGGGNHFSSPDGVDGPIVGFFGRCDVYLESIGVSIRATEINT